MELKKSTRWNPISLFLFSLLLIPIVVHGLKEVEEDLSIMRLELVHSYDPRLAGSEKQSFDRFEIIKKLAQRDILRHHQRWGLMSRGHGRRKLESFEMPMHAGRDYGSGEYFVQVRVGTPPRKFWLIADTGSELTWVNCRDNHNERSKVKRKRVFSTHHSSSFQTVPCSSQKCKVELSDLFSLSACPNPSDPCQYDFRYLDGSAALGFFGSDTITVSLSNGKKKKVSNVLIGCTRSVNNGKVLNKYTDGILGLGYAKNSFVDQAASQHGGKFSYCLVDHLSHRNVSNYLTFGTTTSPKATLLTEIKKTPLVLVPPLYGVNVLGLAIDDQMLRIPPMVWDFKANGGVVIDSGISLTLLTKPAFEPLLEVLLKSLVKFEKVEALKPFDHCYSAKRFDERSVPRLVFHFAGGSRFEPPVKSYVIDVGPQVKCIGILGVTSPGPSTIGNIMQQNHQWEFDLSQNTVGFAPSTWQMKCQSVFLAGVAEQHTNLHRGRTL